MTTLRKKTLFILILTLLALFTVLFSVVLTIMNDGFTRVEQEETISNVHRAYDALSDELSKLTLTVQDWSNWDDVYTYVEDHNEEFVHLNLTDKSLVALKLGLMLIMNNQGQLVFGTGIDLDKGAATPIPDGLETYLQAGTLQADPNNPAKITGILMLPGNPLLIVARPIFNSDAIGPSHGTLLMGEPLDDVTLKALADRTHLSLKIEQYDSTLSSPSTSTSLPLDFQVAQKALFAGASQTQNLPVFIQPLNDQTIVGYTLIKEVTGRPALLLRVDVPRTIYQQGQLSWSYLVISLIVVGLVFGLVTLVLLEKGVLAPLAALSTNVKSIRTTQNLKSRIKVKGKDELASLGRDINLMLDGLELAQATQRESEERYRQLVELSPDTILVQRQGQVVFVNKAGASLIGATSAEQLQGQPLLKFVPPSNSKALQSWLDQGDIRHLVLKEAQIVAIDGRVIDVEVATVPVIYQGQPASQSIIRDISGRKRTEILERDRNQVLELVATNQPLSDVLGHLLRMIEQQHPKAQATVLLKNGRLYQGSASQTLPEELVRAFYEQTVVHNTVGEGLAKYTDPNSQLWVTRLAGSMELREFRETIFNKRLHTAWNNLIFAGNGQVLGSISLFFPAASQPSREDSELIELACKLAAIAIEQRHLTTQLAYQAHHDSLTGLPNRLSFEESLQQTITRINQSNSAAALLFFDLDRFKLVNDTLGHHIGDGLLQQVALRLKQCVRHTDIVARMGGDEFTVILTELKDTNDAVRISQKVMEAFQTPFVIQGHELQISGSLGVSLIPNDGQTTAELLRKADTAMYQAKENGRNNYQLFSMELNTTTSGKLELEKELRRALEREELSLHYQPLLQLKDGSQNIIGVEALLRWNHPTLGLIPPATFIPIAEESGLIIPIGKWVLREACRQNKVWQKEGIGFFKVAVNVSALQFHQADLAETISFELGRSGLEAHWLELELTESVVMSEIEQTALQLSRLRSLGVSISIDDFGTGYSSLNYLRRLPIDTIKIDRSFISELGKETLEMAKEGAIIQAITTLAHSLNLKVLAEGVESVDQLNFLKAIGCDLVQGYYFLKPAATGDLEEWFKQFSAYKAPMPAYRFNLDRKL